MRCHVLLGFGIKYLADSMVAIWSNLLKRGRIVCALPPSPAKRCEVGCAHSIGNGCGCLQKGWFVGMKVGAHIDRKWIKDGKNKEDVRDGDVN